MSNTETTALARAENGSRAVASLAQSEWSVMVEQARMLVPTGFLPGHIKTPEQAVAIMLKGRELGIPAMYSLSNIAVISGKPTCGSELLLALIYRDHGDDALRFTETTAERCTIAYKRRSWTNYDQLSFSIEDARKANLVKAGPWTQYPATMLRWRCVSNVAKAAFPDSIGGMYTPEELGATVNPETGEIIDVPQPTSFRPAQSAEAPAKDKPAPSGGGSHNGAASATPPQTTALTRATNAAVVERIGVLGLRGSEDFSKWRTLHGLAYRTEEDGRRVLDQIRADEARLVPSEYASILDLLNAEDHPIPGEFLPDPDAADVLLTPTVATARGEVDAETEEITGEAEEEPTDDPFDDPFCVPDAGEAALLESLRRQVEGEEKRVHGKSGGPAALRYRKLLKLPADLNLYSADQLRALLDDLRGCADVKNGGKV